MVESCLDSRPFEPTIAESACPGIGVRGVTVPGTLRVPEEILPPGIAFRVSLDCKRGVLLPSLGVDRDDMPERDGIGILCDVEPALDLPADLGADCLRLFLAGETEPAIIIIASVAVNATVDLNLNSLAINPRINAVSGKIRLSTFPLLF